MGNEVKFFFSNLHNFFSLKIIMIIMILLMIIISIKKLKTSENTSEIIGKKEQIHIEISQKNNLSIMML